MWSVRLILRNVSCVRCGRAEERTAVVAQFSSYYLGVWLACLGVDVYIPPRLIKVIIPAYLEFQHMRKSQTIRIQGAAIIINQNVLYREVQYNTDRIKDSTISGPDIWHNDWPFPSPSLISLSVYPRHLGWRQRSGPQFNPGIGRAS